MDKETYAPQLNKLRNYCAYQERCHQEVQRKSSQIGLSSSETKEALTILIEEGFLNEARFAMLWAEGKMRIKKWGPQKIEQGLRLRGITASLIAQVMKNYDQQAQQQYIEEWVSYKLKRLPTTLDTYKKRENIVQFLLQKGFAYDSIASYYVQR